MGRCSQLPEAWLPAAGTPLGQGRPGYENCQAIGPATRMAWCGGRTRRHSKGNGPNLDLTQAQPRTQREVLRGERPKWLFVHFGHSKWTPAERVSPRQGRKAAPENWKKHQLLHQKAWAKAHRDFSICAPWGLAIQAGVWYTAIVSRVV